jgi:hypothetical protein
MAAALAQAIVHPVQAPRRKNHFGCGYWNDGPATLVLIDVELPVAIKIS